MKCFIQIHLSFDAFHNFQMSKLLTNYKMNRSLLMCIFELGNNEVSSGFSNNIQL